MTFFFYGSTASARPIIELAKLDSKNDLKLAPKLKLEQLTVSHFDKMKVSSANNVISNSVASGLRTMIEQQTMPDYLCEIAESTAAFVSSFNRWFDVMASRRGMLALSKHNMEKFTETTQFLSSICCKMKDMKIGDGRWKPVQTGIMLSTQVVLELANELLTDDKQFLMTGRLSQDCLENLFSTVRLKTPTPTPVEFRNTLRIITVSQYMKIASHSSYDTDDSEYLAEFLNSKDVACCETVAEDDVQFLEEVVVSEGCEVDLDDTESAALYYICGWALKAVKGCQECWSKCSLPAPCSALINIAQHTLRKEYKTGALRHPTLEIYNVRVDVEKMFCRWSPVLEEVKTSIGDFISDKMSSLISSIELNPSCKHKSVEQIVQKFVRLRVHTYCIKKTRSLSKQQVHMGSKSMAMRDMVNKL